MSKRDDLLNIESDHPPFAATGPKRLAQPLPASDLSTQWRKLAIDVINASNESDFDRSPFTKRKLAAALIAAADDRDELINRIETLEGATGTSACPICALEVPHYHPESERIRGDIRYAVSQILCCCISGPAKSSSDMKSWIERYVTDCANTVLARVTANSGDGK